MSVGLRNRLIEIFHEDGRRSAAAAVKLADSVIAGLGLREEWGALDKDFGGVLGDSRDEVTARPLHRSERVMRRFITDWVPE